MNDIDSLDQAAYDTVHDYRDERNGRRGVGPLADAIGVAPSTLQNKVDRKQNAANLNVKEARSIMLISGDTRILEALAASVGYACVPLPTVECAADMDLLAAHAEWAADFGETANAIREALDDGKVTQDEIEKVRRELIEDFEKGLAIIDVMKGMAEPLKKIVNLSKAKG